MVHERIESVLTKCGRKMRVRERERGKLMGGK